MAMVANLLEAFMVKEKLENGKMTVIGHVVESALLFFFR